MNALGNRPWTEMSQGKPTNELWLAQQLRPYGVRPRTIRCGEDRAKGYFMEDFNEIFKRYVSRTELKEIMSEAAEEGKDGI